MKEKGSMGHIHVVWTASVNFLNKKKKKKGRRKRKAQVSDFTHTVAGINMTNIPSAFN